MLIEPSARLELSPGGAPSWIRYALKVRPFLTRTAMEPELAFLMANLAQVRGGAAVLDPCP